MPAPSRPRSSRSRLDRERSDGSRALPVQVAAGLVFRAGKLLITQRHPQAHQGGLWEFPGGKREANEDYRQCLQRELREELGIEVQVHEAVATITHAYPDKTVCLQFFRCSWLRHEPKTLGCAAFRWVTACQLDRYPFPGADARLLDLLRERPELWQDQSGP